MYTSLINKDNMQEIIEPAVSLCGQDNGDYSLVCYENWRMYVLHIIGFISGIIIM